jgi:hypothetical protein
MHICSFETTFRRLPGIDILLEKSSEVTKNDIKTMTKSCKLQL